MEYHSVLVIYHLLYLYFSLTERSEINIDILREAFYEFCANINEHNNCETEYDFDTEMSNLLEDYAYLFLLDDDTLSFSTDYPEKYDEFEEIILENLEDATLLDRYLVDFLHNENIYHALRIPAPIKEFQNLFATNAAILSYYRLLAHEELKGKESKASLKVIKFQKEVIKEFITKCDNKTRIKIKLCLDYYNDKFLNDQALPNINSSWYILLLSDSKEAKTTLSYSKISYFMEQDFEPEEEEETEKVTSENLITSAGFIEELNTFLAFYFLYLHDFSKKEQNPSVKKILTEVKYSMLSIGDLDELEDLFLEKGSLDDISLPPLKKEWLTPRHFEFLIGNFEEILTNIKISDQNLNEIKQSKIILNLLLLKCYLDLSINEEVKNRLIQELINPIFYKQENYTYLSNMIDLIIFNNKNFIRKKATRKE